VEKAAAEKKRVADEKAASEKRLDVARQLLTIRWQAAKEAFAECKELGDMAEAKAWGAKAVALNGLLKGDDTQAIISGAVDISTEECNADVDDNALSLTFVSAQLIDEPPAAGGARGVGKVRATFAWTLPSAAVGSQSAESAPSAPTAADGDVKLDSTTVLAFSRRSRVTSSWFDLKDTRKLRERAQATIELSQVEPVQKVLGRATLSLDRLFCASTLHSTVELFDPTKESKTAVGLVSVQLRLSRAIYPLIEASGGGGAEARGSVAERRRQVEDRAGAKAAERMDKLENKAVAKAAERAEKERAKAEEKAQKERAREAAKAAREAESQKRRDARRGA
jgi:hypothetical protein